jgi:simple sugar transport system ATP-binding protein
MSGGNKQKLVVARELAQEAPVIIVENPTWGVDIGAIDNIHRKIMAMREAGHAILLVSSELDEILTLCDRIHVMFQGEISESIPVEKATAKRLGKLMLSKKTPSRRVHTKKGRVHA